MSKSLEWAFPSGVKQSPVCGATDEVALVIAFPREDGIRCGGSHLVLNSQWHKHSQKGIFLAVTSNKQEQHE
jgi:hypothetical protein